MGTVLIIGGLLVWILIMRTVIRKHAEKTKLNICPRCKTTMALNAISRYYCPKCGYHQPLYYTKNNRPVGPFENSHKLDSTVIANIRDQVPRYNKALKEFEDRIKIGTLDKCAITEMYREVEDVNTCFLSLQHYITLNNCKNSIQVEGRDNHAIGLYDWIKEASVRFFAIREWINQNRWG